MRLVKTYKWVCDYCTDWTYKSGDTCDRCNGTRSCDYEYEYTYGYLFHGIAIAGALQKAKLEGFDIAVDNAEIYEHDGWVKCAPYNDWTMARKIINGSK